MWFIGVLLIIIFIIMKYIYNAMLSEFGIKTLLNVVFCWTRGS